MEKISWSILFLSKRDLLLKKCGYSCFTVLKACHSEVPQAYVCVYVYIRPLSLPAVTPTTQLQATHRAPSWSSLC